MHGTASGRTDRIGHRPDSSEARSNSVGSRFPCRSSQCSRRSCRNRDSERPPRPHARSRVVVSATGCVPQSSSFALRTFLARPGVQGQARSPGSPVGGIWGTSRSPPETWGRPSRERRTKGRGPNGMASWTRNQVPTRQPTRILRLRGPTTPNSATFTRCTPGRSCACRLRSECAGPAAAVGSRARANPAERGATGDQVWQRAVAESVAVGAGRRRQ